MLQICCDTCNDWNCADVKKDPNQSFADDQRFPAEYAAAEASWAPHSSNAGGASPSHSQQATIPSTTPKVSETVASSSISTETSSSGQLATPASNTASHSAVYSPTTALSTIEFASANSDTSRTTQPSSLLQQGASGIAKGSPSTQTKASIAQPLSSETASNTTTPRSSTTRLQSSSRSSSSTKTDSPSTSSSSTIVTDEASETREAGVPPPGVGSSPLGPPDYKVNPTDPAEKTVVVPQYIVKDGTTYGKRVQVSLNKGRANRLCSVGYRYPICKWFSFNTVG